MLQGVLAITVKLFIEFLFSGVVLYHPVTMKENSPSESKEIKLLSFYCASIVLAVSKFEPYYALTTTKFVLIWKPE